MKWRPRNEGHCCGCGKPISFLESCRYWNIAGAFCRCCFKQVMRREEEKAPCFVRSADWMEGDES